VPGGTTRFLAREGPERESNSAWTRGLRGLRGAAPRCGNLEQMSEVIFIVEEAPEGGFTARALGIPIFTEADSVAELHVQVRDAVRCHFDAADMPKVIRLHFIRDELISA